MFFLLTLIRKLYKVMSADASPWAIAIGIVFGMTLGFVSIPTGFGIFLILTIIVLPIQLTSALFALGIGGILRGFWVGGLFVPVGEGILEAGALRGFWPFFLNLPLIALLDLDRPDVTGGAAVGLGIGLLLAWPLQMTIRLFRGHLSEKLAKNRYFKWVLKSWPARVLRFIFVGPRWKA